MAAPAPIAAVAWTALLLATTPTPGTRVILLPDDEGRSTAVVVSTQGGEQQVSQPYQQATAAADSHAAPKLGQADPAAVQSEYRELFALRPPKPHQFNLLFDAGGTSLTPASLSTLDKVVAEAQSRPEADITVTGHTDSRGSMTDNDALSVRRAQEICELLVKRGFPAYHVEAVGRGEREPAVPTADEVDEPRNRRAVILVR
ncbi:MAG: OmpA family protein [Proteobacteria bacterium]|nr:OmpA family protein [Pseudomonadota bacterium]